MLLKIALTIAVIYVVYKIVNSKKVTQAHQESDVPNEASSEEEMIACHTCNTYASKDEMILSGSHYYCSEACLKG